MKIENMNVLLTGATGGIGRAIATQLVAHGASVLLTSHSRDDLEALQTELRLIASSPEKVQTRVRLVQELAEHGFSLSVNWDSIYVGSWTDRKVIDLNRYRRKRTEGN